MRWKKVARFKISHTEQMDLLRMMSAKREATGMPTKGEKVKKSGKKPSADDGIPPGTKKYRDFIIAKKPTHKKLKLHFNAIVEKLTESDSEVDTD